MSPRERVLAGLGTARQLLLAAVEDLEEPRFSARPAPGAWSAAQVFEHLARGEGSLARGVRAAAAGKLVVQRRWDDPLRRMLYLTNAYRVARVRTVASLDPAEASPRPEALARIAATRRELVEAIEQGDGRGIWACAIRHPILGPLSMEEMVRFMAYHEERHTLQIGRIRAALERPSS